MNEPDRRIASASTLHWLRWVGLRILVAVPLAGVFAWVPTWPMQIVVRFAVLGLIGQAAIWFSTTRRFADPFAIAVLATDGLLLTVLFAVTDGSAAPLASFCTSFPWSWQA